MNLLHMSLVIEGYTSDISNATFFLLKKTTNRIFSKMYWPNDDDDVVEIRALVVIQHITTSCATSGCKARG